jgi:hypothetical protein
MNRGALLTLLSIALVSPVRPAGTLVLGRALNNSYVGHSLYRYQVGEICRDSLYRWTIVAKRTVTGPRIAGRVEAVVDQETAATQAFVDSIRLFLLRPASDLPFLGHIFPVQNTIWSRCRRFTKVETIASR